MLLETLLITHTVVEPKQTHLKYLHEVELLKEINNNFLARSKWKNKFFTKSIWNGIINHYFKKPLKKTNRIIYSRNSHIPNCFSMYKVFIHKGNINNKLIITNNIVGYKFGEFSFSRKPFFYPKKEPKTLNKR